MFKTLNIKAVLALVSASVAVALSARPSVAASTDTVDQESKLEEIIVTAQKRVENLQTVPISAQVISAEKLTTENYNTLDDLTQTIPGVHVSTGNFSNTLSIRGVSSGGSASFDQSVAIFVDDIYYGRSRTSDTTFLDLDRIEVLKGPQSTFFGNNAIAGALNVVTKKPGDTFDASARVLYGTYGQYATEGAVTLPIDDKLSIRAAATFNGEGGWIKNVDTGKYAPDENNKAGRVTATLKPSSDFDATMKVGGSESRTTGTPYTQPLQFSNCPPPAPLTPAAIGLAGNCVQALALKVPTGTNNNLNSGLADQGDQLSTFEDVLTLNVHQWDYTFTSVTGFNNYHYTANVDVGNLPVALLTQQVPEKYHQLSQEFRVASPVGQPLEYLLGGYFQTDELDWNAILNAPFLNAVGGLFGIPAQDLPLSINEPFSQNEHVYSLFGSLLWNVTDSLRINAGLRGSWVNKDFDRSLDYGTGTQVYGGYVAQPLVVPLGSLIFEAPGSQEFSRSDKAIMPSAGIQYQLDPQAMVYFSYTKGFLAGGFNGSGGLNAPQDPGYGPEHVNAYEVGLKSKWIEDRLLLNVDVFRSDYQDLQVSAVISDPETNTYATETTNAAQSRSQGVEIEAQWIVVRDFRIGANVTYLDSYYVSFPNASPTTLDGFSGKTSSDLSGQRTNYAPLWSGSLSASYGISLPGDYKLTTQLSPYFTSRYYTQSPDQFYLVNAYTRLDGRLTFESPGGRWAIDLIGKNLTDRIIVVLPGIPTAAKEEPRNGAVQFRYHF